ncbi:PHP domain-containing protein [Kineococcus sp. NBC_00420]|uniref:PHP domain-containing protein n=1 Tax=Kineococcus sp. NBC_00420 TaxID=2903564 RepID=UPI002E20807B
MTEPSITSAAPANTPTSLPADDHTHSQFSWDSFHGNMRASCEHALVIGLPAISFTEHVDFTVWNAPPGGWAWDQGIRDSYDDPIGPGGHGHFMGAPLEVDAYQAAIEDCRHRFPDLTIRSGVEMSEVHWHTDAIRDVLSRGFDRIVGSIHTLEDTRAPGEHLLVDHAKDQHSPVDLLAAYLSQVEAMVASDGPFEVLGHIDFSLRHWTPDDGPSPWGQVEEQTRHVLGVLAASGRVLEVNTSIPLDLRMVRWWHEAGGTAVSFGSDAHVPSYVGRRFREVSKAVAALGFRPAQDPTAFWGRT